MYTQEQLEEAGLDDFRVFLAQVWDHIGLPEPTPVQYKMAEYLQHGPRRRIIMAFRGVGKSWITVAYCVWRLFKNPQLKIMQVSASQGLADNSAKFAHQLIKTMPLLAFLKPGKDDRQSALAFDVGPSRPSKDPSLKSAGITGQITGTRADLIVPDDVEIPENSYTHHRREKLAEQVKEFDDILKPDGEIVYLGTPQVEETLYRRLQKRGFVTRIWPAEVPETTYQYSGDLAPYVQGLIEDGVEPGTPVDPKRFNAQELAEKFANHGRTRYALQFMLDTSLSDADKHPLKTRDLLIQDVDEEQAHVKLVWGRDKEQVIEDLPSGGFDGDFYVRPAWKSEEMVPFQGTVMAMDPSGRGKDETAYAVVRKCQGMLYLVDVGGFQDGFDDSTLRALAAKMARHNVNWYVAEDNYGGGMFTKVLKPYVRDLSAKTSHDDEWNAWSTGKKEWRILDTLEPVVHSHRLVVDRRVIEKDLEQQRDNEKYSFVQQFTRMARLKDCLAHEDRLEAVAMGVGYWTERMDAFTVDADEAVEKHKAKKMEEELRNWHRNVHLPVTQPGQKRPRRDNWTGHRGRRR